MARPRIEIDQEQFQGLCSMQCTLAEIASFFKCSEDTVERWCKRELHMSFADAYKIHSAGGKISLRRHQFKLAERSAAMAIWLGKQYLGQHDLQEISVSNNMDEAIREMDEYFKATNTGTDKGQSD